MPSKRRRKGVKQPNFAEKNTRKELQDGRDSGGGVAEGTADQFEGKKKVEAGRASKSSKG